MWYLQDRAQAAIRDNKPVAGTPFSARACTTGRLFPGKLAPPQAPYDTQVLKASGSPAVQAGLSRAQPVEQVVDQMNNPEEVFPARDVNPSIIDRRKK